MEVFRSALRAYVSATPPQAEKAIDTMKRLEREVRFNRTVQEVLKALETGAEEKMAKQMPWVANVPKRPE